MSVLRFKKLEGWITLPEAATLLDVSRQDVEKKLKAHQFDEEDVRTIGGGRPIYLVSLVSVERMKAASGDMTEMLLAV